MGCCARSRILLIADEQSRLDAMRGLLVPSPQSQPTEIDYAAEAFSEADIESVLEGSEGLSRLRQAIWDGRPFAMAVIDVRVPSPWDGPETAWRLAQTDPELAIVLAKCGGSSGELSEPVRAIRRLVVLSERWNAAELRLTAAAQLDRRLVREELGRARLELDATRRALERMREEAQEAERIKRQLLANISHEVRTPMNAILGFTRLLLREPLATEQLEKLRHVHDAGHALLKVIESVLDFSMLSAGKLPLDLSTFHLDAAIREEMDSVQPAATDKGLVVHCHVDPSAPRRLRGDVGRFRQVLASLLSNAVKFTDHGDVHVRVTVDEDAETAVTLRVVVTDTGVGIPPERQSRVFDSFSQVDGSTTRRFAGIGLGLAVAKRVVELMGGQIGFRSVPDQGSSFWFTVAFEKDQAPSALAAQPWAEPSRLPTATLRRAAGDAEGRTAAQTRILVAEKDRLDRLLLEALLTRTGCAVDLVSNGREALAVLRSNNYQLAFVNVQAAEDDGLATIRRIRQAEAGTDQHLKIVAISARAEPDDRERCLAAGADQYLAKPFSAEELLGAFERWLPGLLDDPPGEPDAAARDAASAPASPQALAESLDGLRRALVLPDFPELEARAQAVRRWAAHAGSAAAADAALRVQLAARRADLDRASAAVERLERAFNGRPAAAQRGASTSPRHSD